MNNAIVVLMIGLMLSLVSNFQGLTVVEESPTLEQGKAWFPWRRGRLYTLTEPWVMWLSSANHSTRFEWQPTNKRLGSLLQVSNVKFLFCHILYSYSRDWSSGELCKDHQEILVKNVKSQSSKTLKIIKLQIIQAQDF